MFAAAAAATAAPPTPPIETWPWKWWVSIHPLQEVRVSIKQPNQNEEKRNENCQCTTVLKFIVINAKMTIAYESIVPAENKAITVL
jgi:hypothetical protein